MKRRIFIFDKTLGTTVEITPTRHIESAPTVLVKNATANKIRRGNSNPRWPMVSENAGCQPEQVAEANHNCRKMGIAAEYLPNGDVVWSSPKAKREHIRSIGLHDRSGYY
jgi:hypothetical protein